MAQRTRLRLWRETSPAERDRSEERVLRFPTDAVRGFPTRGERDENAPGRATDPAITSRQLIRDIEATLDRMQDRLNDVREQVDEAFRPNFSSDDSDRPSAA